MKWSVFATLLPILVPIQAISQESKVSESFDQQRFAEAYNRKDVEAMAMAFSADAIRVTPSGIFHGRDEIRRGFQDALNLGLHEYTVRRTDSRTYGDLVFNVGEWQAKVGEQPLRGYYTSVLGREGDQVKILEETVTVSVSGK
jgi:ketosteroid isomerase-like protein